ncbi:neuronal acetylcholine receptor subunit alpha-10 [Plakobranchus ocellatus]|uniref:Neuronal acetylcholine receptor subunit alpha-10 n=1 Tax=Plakobranchus ocellatus TaxID=259542 RepID=A0AAV3ZSN1_9GAST|nr:neuronal acetylcholine receptor subunit alpha-10 [Plakobranchus ocellatus]
MEAGRRVGIQIARGAILLHLLFLRSEAAPNSTGWMRVPDEQLLYERIMGGYVKWVRPVLNLSQPIKVKFAMRLNQIVSLDERQQVLTTNVFIDQTWIDPALAWDPAEFKDVRALRIPADQVWRPDTFIYNNADNGSTGFIAGTYIQIRHTGAVSWPVPVRLRSSCVVKITYFPFDRQYCMVRFGSWIYSQSLVDYEVRQDVSSVDLSSFTKNSEWELLAMRLEKAVVSRTRGHGMHPHLTAVIYLKRNTFFYLFNIIVPCCMLSILTLMTFWLPPTSCEKVTLGLNVFLAFSMFMLLIAEEVPASSDAVPLIGLLRRIASLRRSRVLQYRDAKGVILLVILPQGQCINAARYCSTLDRLKEAICRKRPGLLRRGVVLQHNYATPHSANLTQQWLQRYGWEILPHPAHSSDLAPSDFHLFGPLKRHLGGMAFETEDDLISELRNWFDNLDVDFFRVGINLLLWRWQKCIDLHGDYVEK